MRAAVLTTVPALELELEELEEPVAGEGCVVLSVKACGICGTDLHIMSGTSYRPCLPFVLGHEPVGVVVELGAGVERGLLGRKVTATQFVGCGKCRMCLRGDVRLCENGPLISGVLGLSGGFAERMVLRATQLVPIPEGLDWAAAATLVDAGATAHNVARVLQGAIAPGEGPHLVVGAGPVGFLVAELLRFAHYDVVIVETNGIREEEMSRLGYETSSSLSDLVADFAGVVDCSGAPEAVAAGLALLRPHGMYFPVGYSTVPAFDMAVVARRELVLRGIRSGARGDLAEVLDLVAQGHIRLPRRDVWPLEEINTALHHLRSGGVPGKAIIANGVPV